MESSTMITETDLNLSNEKIQDFSNIDLEPFEKSSVWSDEYLSTLNIQRRPFDFQVGLVQSVIKSENSIVCLRTGAGKTYISALLIKYYYMKKKKEKKHEDFLTFFFIPHRSIRDQQVKALRDVGDLRVISCDDNSSANQFIHHNHVIVCTPQKFLNCLLDKTISLNYIDLIIFDECHNCIGRHPYSQIMEQYLVYHPVADRTRIIGLTASCGTKLTNPQALLKELFDEKTRKAKALGKLYELCATLNCFDVVNVIEQQHVEELNNKVPRPTDDRILTVESIPFDQYLKELKESLTELLTRILSRCSPDPEITNLTDEQKLVEARISQEKKNHFTNIILINYMIIFVKRFNALGDLPLRSVMIDIEKKLDLFYKRKETPLEVETEVHDICLKKISNIVTQLKQSQYYLTNPKLDFLTNLLREQINKRDKNARGLVLVSRTLYAKLMFDYLKEREDIQDIIKPCWLVGQSGVDYQNSLSEQDKTLKDFRKGLSNVMIATDIVQEGLDVPECSFVIRYEFVSNEIGTVQSRGRARADKSACYLVVDLYSENHEKERINRLKEQEMIEALNDWRRVPTDQVKENIRTTQNSIIGQWQAEAELRELIRANLTDPNTINGKVSCRCCDYYLGELSWLRQRNNNYFIPERQLVEQVEIERYLQPEIYKEIQVNGVVRCGNKQCRQDLGGAQNFIDRPDIKEICVLKCKQLKFFVKNETDKDECLIHKKWSDVKFKIINLEPLQYN
ncbi:unnamed protein product [Adineta steineri]|uniref:RNA helicase n=1 Tax=Adineta steineri TaxID=433720 RepID=A0A815BEP9_9BILA|nr:unnamed protein product [Adineta steineri]CAF1492904.1 unnamed protein product [Adineta steineri]